MIQAPTVDGKAEKIHEAEDLLHTEENTDREGEAIFPIPEPEGPNGESESGKHQTRHGRTYLTSRYLGDSGPQNPQPEETSKYRVANKKKPQTTV